MKNWLKKRASEATTWLGLAFIIQGVGAVGKINEAPYVADAITAAAQPLASGDYTTAATAIIGGLLAVLMREKGNK